MENLPNHYRFILFQYLPNFKFGNEYWADIWENMGEKFTQAGLHAA